MASENVGSIHYDVSLDTSKFDAAQKKLKTQLSQAGSAFDGVADGIQNVATKMLILGAAGAAGIGKFVGLASDLQTTQRQMAALAGSTEAANKIFGELYTYTLGKPIAFPDAAKAAQVLMGYGVTANNVLGAMKTLSAFSIVNGADMSQLALAYGQVNAKGKLMGQEIIQLTNNFVPVSQVIAKYFNVSLQKAQELMEGGKVTAAEFNAAMASFIPESAIAAQTNTFKNRMISLQGTIRSVGLALIGVRVDPALGLVVEPGGVFDRLSGMLPRIADYLKSIKPQLIGAFKFLVDHGKDILFIMAGIGAAFLGAKVAAIGFNAAAAIASNPFTLIAAAVAALIGILTFLQLRFNIFGKFLDLFRGPIQAIVDAFNNDLGPALKGLWDRISPALIPALEFLAKLLAGALYVAIWGILKVFGYLVTAVSKVVDGINWMIDTTKSIISQIKPTYDRFKAIAGDTVDAIKDKWKDLGDGINSFLDRMKKLIQPWRDNFNKTLVDSLKTAADKMIQYDIETLTRWAETLAKTGILIYNWFTALPDKIGAWLSGVGAAIAKWATDTYNQIANAIVNTINNIGNWLAGLPDKIVSFLSSLPQKIMDFFTNMYNSVAGWVNSIGQQLAQQHTDGIKNGFNMDKVRQVGDAVIGFLLLVVATIAIYFVDAGVRLIGYLISGMYNGLVALPGVISNLANRIFGGIGGFLGGVYNAGRDIAIGLANGVRDGAGAVYERIKDICARSINQVKQFFGIHSPSKVMAIQGNYIMQGLGLGIKRGAERVIGTMGNTASSIADQLSGQAQIDMMLRAANNSALNGTGNGGITNSSNVRHGDTILNIGQINSTENADYLLRRVNRNAELESMGASPTTGAQPI